MTSDVRPASAVRERPLHRDLGFRVQVRGRLVEDDDVGRLEQQPGDREPLLLAARQPVSAVAHDRVQAVGQRLDRTAGSGPRASASMQLGLGRVGPRVRQVRPDRVVEEVRVLRDDTDGVAQRVEVASRDVDARRSDGARRGRRRGAGPGG